MSQLNLNEVSTAISHIDIAMLTTKAVNGYVAARPMSNNGEVEYDGDNYFFAFEESHTVEDIKRDPKIGLSFVGKKGLLGKPVFIAIEAAAELLRDKALFKQHWNKDIEAWADQGIDTPGLILIKAHALRIHYWDGHDERELIVQ